MNNFPTSSSKIVSSKLIDLRPQTSSKLNLPRPPSTRTLQTSNKFSALANLPPLPNRLPTFAQIVSASSSSTPQVSNLKNDKNHFFSRNYSNLISL